MAERVAYVVAPVGGIPHGPRLLETMNEEEALNFAKEREASGERVEVGRQALDSRGGVWDNIYTSPPA